MATPFDDISKPIPVQAASALARVGIALRSRAWSEGEKHGLTPTQAQILGLLAGDDAGLRPSAIAERLQVSRPTISDAVKALAEKGLVERVQAGADGRSAILHLTDVGRRAAGSVGDWPDFLVRAIGGLPPVQQEALYRGLIGTIRALQLQGDIPVQRLCVTCRHFRPYHHADPATPHHCMLVDAPFGDRHLRLDCPEQEPAEAVAQNEVWTRFLGPDMKQPHEEKA